MAGVKEWRQNNCVGNKMFIEEYRNNTLAGWPLEILRKWFWNINRNGNVKFGNTREETQAFCFCRIIFKVHCCIILRYAKVALRRKTQRRIVTFKSSKLSHFKFEFELNSGNIIELLSVCHAKRTAFLLQRSTGESSLGKYSVCCDNQSTNTRCTVRTKCRFPETYSRWYKLLPLYCTCWRNESSNSCS
jgi:hypothetical protein